MYGPELQRYTSYRGHASSEGAVKQILPCDKGILSISARSVHFSHRRGLAQWHITCVLNFSPFIVFQCRLTERSHESMTDLRCMSFTSKGSNEILVAGCQSQMYKIDVYKGVITSTVRSVASQVYQVKGAKSYRSRRKRLIPL